MSEQLTDLRIDTVDDAHAGELLTIRRAAFVSEAQILDDPHIPPLTQTLDELRSDLANPSVVTLGAWSGTRLVGSVRVEIDGGKATLGRFAVVPDLQQQGIGKALLLNVPGHLPAGITEIWVFTGKDSVANIAMYGKHGFAHEFDQTTGDLTYAFLRKILGEDGAVVGTTEEEPG